MAGAEMEGWGRVQGGAGLEARVRGCGVATGTAPHPLVPGDPAQGGGRSRILKCKCSFGLCCWFSANEGQPSAALWLTLETACSPETGFRKRPGPGAWKAIRVDRF